MKEETQSTAPLPPQPTKMGADKQEEENKEDLKLKEKPNAQEGALVVVDHPVKKEGTCGTLGPGLFDLFLRLGFLKVRPFEKKQRNVYLAYCGLQNREQIMSCSKIKWHQ